MFDFLTHTPVDDAVVAVNRVIRAIEFREDISDTFESECIANGEQALSPDEQVVARSIAKEIRQIENLPISYLTDEAASEYTSLLAQAVQRSVKEHVSNQEIQRGREILRGWRNDAPAIAADSPAEDFHADRPHLTYFLLGAGIGVVLALLFAPKSGEELRDDIADATRKGINKSRQATQQLGNRAGEAYDATRTKTGEYYATARETAGEYYEATRERATELYETGTTKVGEVAVAARDAAVRQASSVQAAVKAGKKAYELEKRKTELSGRTEATPTYKPKTI